jgi:large subunit ribosomal protein L22
MKEADMEAVAKGKYIRGSARKMRQVVDLVRGRNVEEALNILRFTRKKSSLILEKVVRSAVANAMNIHGDKIHDPNELTIAEVMCDEGPTMKRIRPRAMGRAYRIRKRSCHVTVRVATGK